MELAAAIILSGKLGRPVDVPVDRAAFDELMRELSGGKDPRSKRLAAHAAAG